VHLVVNVLIIETGPMGKYEDPLFSHGTRDLLEYLSSRTSSNVVTVIGGGDTVAATHSFGILNFSHLSTGAASNFTLLCGRPLPGLDAIPDAVEEASPTISLSSMIIEKAGTEEQSSGKKYFF
jgi:3-phosphoglycerate kinase